MPVELYTIGLPLLITVALAIMGYFRGVYREAIVAASIVLSAVIIDQWIVHEWSGSPDTSAGSWAKDLSSVSTSLTVGQWQFVLSIVILALVVLVVGYFMGGVAVREPLSSQSRALGAVLGFVNGAAISGWVLRFIYVALDGQRPDSAVYQSGVAQGFMIWAGWFPVALALLGAVLALLIPLLRPRAIPIAPSTPLVAATSYPLSPANTTTATPPPATPRPYPSAPPPTVATGAGGAPYTYSYTPPTAVRRDSEIWAGPAATVASDEDYRRRAADAPTVAVRPMQPESQVPQPPPAYSPPAPTGLGIAAPPPVETAPVLPAPPSQTVEPVRSAPVTPPHDIPGGAPAAPSSWSSTPTMVAPEATGAPPAAPAPESAAEPPRDAAGAPASAAETASPVANVERCPNCGAPVAANQYFCTECGARVRRST